MLSREARDGGLGLLGRRQGHPGLAAVDARLPLVRGAPRRRVGHELDRARDVTGLGGEDARRARRRLLHAGAAPWTIDAALSGLASPRRGPAHTAGIAPSDEASSPLRPHRLEGLAGVRNRRLTAISY